MAKVEYNDRNTSIKVRLLVFRKENHDVAFLTFEDYLCQFLFCENICTHNIFKLKIYV